MAADEEHRPGGLNLPPEPPPDEQATPTPPVGRTRFVLAGTERSVLAAVGSGVGFVSGASAFLSDRFDSGPALLAGSTAAVALLAIGTVVLMRFWASRNRTVSVPVTMIAVAVALGVGVGVAAGYGYRAGTQGEAAVAASPSPSTLASTAAAAAPTPSADRRPSCWALTDAVGVLAKSLRAIQPTLTANAGDKPVALKPGFSSAAEATRGAVQEARNAFAAYVSAGGQVPPNEFVSQAEFVVLLDEADRIVNNLESKVPDGNGDPDDYTAPPDRAGRFEGLAAKLRTDQCPR